jgi:hypothetical protein
MNKIVTDSSNSSVGELVVHLDRDHEEAFTDQKGFTKIPSPREGLTGKITTKWKVDHSI